MKINGVIILPSYSSEKCSSFLFHISFRDFSERSDQWDLKQIVTSSCNQYKRSSSSRYYSSTTTLT